MKLSRKYEEFQAIFFTLTSFKENFITIYVTKWKAYFLIYLLWKSTQEPAKLYNYASYQFIVSQLQIYPSLSALWK